MSSTQKIVAMVNKKLEWYKKSGCETDVILIKKQGDEEQLGISDIGEHTERFESHIKIIIMTRGSDKNIIGQTQNSTSLGDNPDVYLEFVRIPDVDNLQKIDIGNRILYEGEEYLVYENLPVILGNTLLLNQYVAKKVT